MWLLRVDDATLHHFQEGQSPPYAILSHVWRGEEQSFQAVMAINSTVAPDANGSRTLPLGLSPKIHYFCTYAQKRGYKWAWIDTCCIDKSSSAELSEALNSMYSYYAKAEICFAFLDDIRGDEDPRGATAMFRLSAWFQRGWTLQELLAPHAVIFLSPQWQPVGTNHALADVIEEITGIDQAVLTHQLPLREVSVARRMSWASKRKTTRVEDGAYSLMGIFNVFMPTVYGEGTRAFTRLQEEILKQLPDQSIFAWGPKIQVDHDATMRDIQQRPLSAQTYQSRLAFERHRGLQGLLARSPRDFEDSGNIRPVPFRVVSEALGLQVPVPVYHLTSGGLRIQMPVILVESTSSAVIPGTSVTMSSAVLACQDEHENIVVLYLRRESEHADAYSVGLPTEAQYLRAALWRRHSSRPREVQIVDFYVMHRPQSDSMLPYFPLRQSSVPSNIQVSGPISIFFYFPVWVLARMQLSGFSPAIGIGGRWGIQPLPVAEGISAEVQREGTMRPATAASMVASQLFWNAGSVGTSGAVQGATVMRVSFWIGCSCPPRDSVEDIWIDIELDPDLAGTHSRRLTHDAEGRCTRAHLSRDISVLHFQRGYYNFECRVVPWCGYPVRSDGIASCEYLMDISVREPQSAYQSASAAYPQTHSVEMHPNQPPWRTPMQPGLSTMTPGTFYYPLPSRLVQLPVPQTSLNSPPHRPPPPPVAPHTVHFAPSPKRMMSGVERRAPSKGDSTQADPLLLRVYPDTSSATPSNPATLFYNPGVAHYLVPVSTAPVQPDRIPAPPEPPLHMPMARRPHPHPEPRVPDSPFVPPPYIPPYPSPMGEDSDSSSAPFDSPIASHQHGLLNPPVQQARPPSPRFHPGSPPPARSPQDGTVLPPGFIPQRMMRGSPPRRQTSPSLSRSSDRTSIPFQIVPPSRPESLSSSMYSSPRVYVPPPLAHPPPSSPSQPSPPPTPPAAPRSQSRKLPSQIQSPQPAQPAHLHSPPHPSPPIEFEEPAQGPPQETATGQGILWNLAAWWQSHS